MKKVNVILLSILLWSCNPNSEKCNQIIVGNTYHLEYVPDNPFEHVARATVVVTAKENGYVQYCWKWDYGKKDIMYYSRTCQQFYDLIKKK